MNPLETTYCGLWFCLAKSLDPVALMQATCCHSLQVHSCTFSHDRAECLLWHSVRSACPRGNCFVLIQTGIKWAVPFKNMSSGLCRQQRLSSACTSTQSDQGLHCLLTEWLDTIDGMNVEQRPG